jgi:AcrR family transcriptional regulator
MSRSPSCPPETKERIIAAAGAVFAERGFRSTTIRQITARAGVNLAAVNYHFRDKGELYAQVLLEAKRHVTWIVIADFDGGPEDKLRSFITRFVSSLLDPKRPSWHGRVIAMEMANPTAALQRVVRELTAPLHHDVRGLIGEILEGKATATELDLFTLSIIGQCVFYACSRPMVEQLAVHLGKQPDRIAKIAAHIADFSLAALRAFRRGGTAKPARRPALKSSRG